MNVTNSRSGAQRWSGQTKMDRQNRMRTLVRALPYRFVGNTCEVLLVTSRRSGKWILPKGKIEAGETAAERAAAEAFEEGGVLGHIASRPLLAGSRADLSRPPVFPLEVVDERAAWPEMRERRRAWLSIADARERLISHGLRQALDALAAQVEGERRG